MATTIITETPVCSWCGNTGWMEVPEASYNAWQSRTMLIQDAFPHLTPAQREQLKTGYHPECWEKMFGQFD